MIKPADRLIVALDMPVYPPSSIKLDAFQLIDGLMNFGVKNFKVGTSSLIMNEGSGVIDYIVDKGGIVMLDLKLRDTPDTVKCVVEAAQQLGVGSLTVDVRSVSAAVEAAAGSGITILAVDFLTSDGPALGRPSTAFEDAGGLVCHPSSAQYFRARYPGKIIVCPGIRPVGLATDNHVYPVTPAEAINNGADYLVVGRPIINAPDPVGAALSIVREIEEAVDVR